MPIAFEQPWWLLVALLAVPMGIVGWKWLAAMSPIRRASALVLRALLFGLIACLLAGASAVRSSDRVAVVAVVDVSDSVRQFADRFADLPTDDKGRRETWAAAIQNWLTRAGADRAGDDLLGVVAFDGASVALATPMPTGELDIRFEPSDQQGSDIAGALRFARALFPAGSNRRLVLVSDGNQTGGDAAAAAAELAADSIPVDVVPLAYNVRNEVIIESVDAPPQAAANSTVRVRVVLEATDEARGQLEMLYEGRPLDLNPAGPGTGRRITLRPGRTVELIDVPLTDATVHRFEPVFVPDDQTSDQIVVNNRAEAFTVTPGKGRVLIVDGVSNAQPGGAGLTLGNTLNAAGIEATTISPQDLPQDLLSLNAFDLIVLQNTPSETVGRTTQKAMADFVTKLGGGLVMVGGPDSFGAGGWKGSPLEPILPVRLDLPEQIVAPPAAVALVLDNSGSMRSTLAGTMQSKQQIANEGAALAIMTLDKSDALCVIAFNSDHEIVIPMGRNSSAQQSADRVRAIGSGGGTSIGPAMAAAGAQLGKLEKTTVKHMIVLTDGRDEQNANLTQIAQTLKARGITISTIGVGDDVDVPVLAQVASAGGGKFYNVTDATVLPRVFIKEIRVVRKPLIHESPFVPRSTGSGSALIEGLSALPALEGLVLSQRRPAAKATTALVTPEGEPVLAHWAAGRGQVAAFTSDAHAAWARRWLDWPGYSQLWTRIARAIARPSAESTSELTVQVVEDELLVRLDAADREGVPQDLLSVPGTVYSPDGKSTEIRLDQVGPGAYQARLPARQTGNYIVALSPSAGQRRLPPVIGGVSLTTGPELRRLKSNIGLLERIARTTGGRVLDLKEPADAKLFDRSGLRATLATLPLWRTLLLWTLAVLVLDIGTRRLAWDRLVSREWRLAMRENAERTVRGRADQAAATLAALRRAPAAGAGPSANAAPGPVAGAPPGAARPAPRREIPSAAPDEIEALRAAQIEAEKETRRAALRARTLRARAGQPEDPAPENKPPEPGKPGQDDSNASTNDLLKAKRRARQRFEDEP